MIDKIEETSVAGCFRIIVRKFCDERGLFIKTFHEAEYAKLGLATGFKEQYYSVSNKNVLRGMHFQRPPMDHVKLVYCISGEVQDVVLDLRKGSPSFGKHVSFKLYANDGQLVYMPKGVAHGFLSLQDGSILVYNVSSTYSEEHDSGVLWNSCGIDWEIDKGLIISKRDQGFGGLDMVGNIFS